MTGLRVISGKARGFKLKSVAGDTTRPITDRVKEALFNIIGPDLREGEGATFLDLFAGTGAVGIEALSRGAKFVRFIDFNWQAVATIRTNLTHTGLGSNAEVLRMDAFTQLEHPADRVFDYIYIAPPQYHELWNRALRKLDNHPDWLSQDAWIIVQIHPIEYEEILLDNLSEFDQRRYGSTILIFYERK